MKNKLPEECTSIEEVRKEIDVLDKEILRLLGERFKYVKEIVRFKNKDKESIVALDRYVNVINQRKLWGKENGLNPEVIEKMYKLLIGHFIKEEMKILEQMKK